MTSMNNVNKIREARDRLLLIVDGINNATIYIFEAAMDLDEIAQILDEVMGDEGENENESD